MCEHKEITITEEDGDICTWDAEDLLEPTWAFLRWLNKKCRESTEEYGGWVQRIEMLLEALPETVDEIPEEFFEDGVG